jgi:Mlc titration factor MtfA (ptsG expression regulator)
MTAVFVVAMVFILLTGSFFYFAGKNKGNNHIVPENTEALLLANVAFYKELDEDKRQLFAARAKDFLADVAVKGIEVDITPADRILVAAGAIIPIFAFSDWKYRNISEVLLYRGAFNKKFETDGEERNVLGMVGDGAMHRVMIMSLPSLRASFANPTDGHNTAIHEFAHLIDKADGAVDGVPEYLLQRPHILPWVKEMHKEMAILRHKKHPDINTYGATSDAEFFAVVAEYLFERPEKLKAAHPELYELLDEMFQPVQK